MQYKIINTDSIINKITETDNLFAGDYTVDPYQNCEFGCLYCDSSFDKNIFVKLNSQKIFEKQLKNIKKGNVIIGSVHDPYQKAEEKYKMTRNLLKTIKKNNISCHILTKSDFVLRDLDILSEINNCIVTISITSLNDNIVDIFEKNVTSPKLRLKTVQKLSDYGIKTGVAIIPVLPFIVEEKELEDIVKASCGHQANFLLHKHLELKGDLKNVFLGIINKYFPNFLKNYEQLFLDSYIPKKEYIQNIDRILNQLCKKYDIKNKI